MKKEVAEAWVKDLRTNPPQCYGKLHDGKGYCCLGRLALVLGAEFKEETFLQGFPYFNGVKQRQDAVLSPDLMEAAGLKSNSGLYDYGYASLANDNDSIRMSFAKIADVIEQKWEQL